MLRLTLALLVSNPTAAVPLLSLLRSPLPTLTRTSRTPGCLSTRLSAYSKQKPLVIIETYNTSQSPSVYSPLSPLPPSFLFSIALPSAHSQELLFELAIMCLRRRRPKDALGCLKLALENNQLWQPLRWMQGGEGGGRMEGLAASSFERAQWLQTAGLEEEAFGSFTHVCFAVAAE